MVTIAARHIETWNRAHELTRPAKDEQPPSYGAHHRPKRRRSNLDDGQETQEAETPGVLSLAVQRG